MCDMTGSWGYLYLTVLLQCLFCLGMGLDLDTKESDIAKLVARLEISLEIPIFLNGNPSGLQPLCCIA